MRGKYFREQVAGLSPRYRCIVPDLRAHGESGPLQPGQGITALAEDIAELMAHLDIANVTLVGWSMGAMVCWSLMQLGAANRVSGIVSIDMVPKILSDSQWPFGLRKGDKSVFAHAVARMTTDWPAFTRNFVPRIFARGSDAQSKNIVAEMVADAEKNDPESMARLWMSLAEQDFREQLGGLEKPCLVTYGRQSKLYREEASLWLAAKLPDARAVAFSKSGHAPHLEEPDKFNSEIMAFVGQSGSD